MLRDVLISRPVCYTLGSLHASWVATNLCDKLNEKMLLSITAPFKVTVLHLRVC